MHSIKVPLFPPLEKGSYEKIEKYLLSLISPFPGNPLPQGEENYILSQFFHIFRGTKGDLTAFQKTKGLPSCNFQ